MAGERWVELDVAYASAAGASRIVVGEGTFELVLLKGKRLLESLRERLRERPSDCGLMSIMGGIGGGPGGGLLGGGYIGAVFNGAECPRLEWVEVLCSGAEWTVSGCDVLVIVGIGATASGAGGNGCEFLTTRATGNMSSLKRFVSSITRSR